MKKSKETSEVVVSTIAELEIKAKEKAKETIANQLQVFIINLVIYIRCCFVSW